MNAKLLEGVAAKLSERLVATIVSPAFVFLSVGFLAWLWAHGWVSGWADVSSWIQRRKTGEVVLLIVGSLLGVLVLGSLAQAIAAPVIRLMEGYWPRWLAFAGKPLLWCQHRRFRQRDIRFQTTAAAALIPGASQHLRWEATRAEDDLARYPVEESMVLPTRLGNTLRASELRPFYKYGLDPVRCWRQLWLVLPDSARNEIVAARSRLDAAAVAFTFSLAVAVWTLWAWWAIPLAIGAAVVTYRIYAIPAAEAYGDLIEAACDVHRPTLFTALRFRLPETPMHDHKLATFVNRYIQRGENSGDRIFLRPGS